MSTLSNNAHYPVIIAGGGPVGLSCAALLANYGISSLVIEADKGYCTGSRAICVSRRSQEIMAWFGADQAVIDKGLPWTGGRSYYQGSDKNSEVLHFEMPHDTTQRFAPMVNIQQYYIEQFAHEAAQRTASPPHIAWGHTLLTVNHNATGATLTVQTPHDSPITLRCDWLIACDGGRSTVREQLGVQLEGMQYDGKYVIVDIKQTTHRPTERLAWFDPPSNPGSTILMHRQPDDVWRIDYQISEDEDPAEAVKPENVLPRVQSHLDMIGETAPWTPLWISLYNAKCLTLPQYRYGRVLFAGDAAHLVPIFGVRGLNSGIDDVGNLAWKLARVLRGQASEHLLDSYSSERVSAARENIAYGAKSTEFMAPPHRGFELMRRAALRLALEVPAMRSLLNPRQSLPVEYVGSPLNLETDTTNPHSTSCTILRAGMVAPDAPFKQGYLSQQFGAQFTLLHFGEQVHAPKLASMDNVKLISLDKQAHSLAWQRYSASQGLCVLVRPDGYIMAVWASPEAVDVGAALAPLIA